MTRKNKDATRTAVICPLAVKFYNEHMSSVDLVACKQQVYTCSKKAKKDGTDYFLSFWKLSSSMVT